MPLRIKCPNGCVMRVPANRAGMSARCPGCKSVVVIPFPPKEHGKDDILQAVTASSSIAEPSGQDPTDSADAKVAGANETARPKTNPKKSLSKKKSKPNPSSAEPRTQKPERPAKKKQKKVVGSESTGTSKKKRKKKRKKKQPITTNEPVVADSEKNAELVVRAPKPIESRSENLPVAAKPPEPPKQPLAKPKPTETDSRPDWGSSPVKESPKPKTVAPKSESPKFVLPEPAALQPERTGSTEPKPPIITTPGISGSPEEGDVFAPLKAPLENDSSVLKGLAPDDAVSDQAATIDALPTIHERPEIDALPSVATTDQSAHESGAFRFVVKDPQTPRNAGKEETGNVSALELRTKRANADRVTLTRFFAALLMFVGLVNFAPAIYCWYTWSQNDIDFLLPRWIYLQIFIAILHLIYSLMLLQVPDWTTLRSIAVVMLVFAFVFGVFSMGLLTTGSNGLLAQFLQVPGSLGRQACIWCVAMLCLATLASYLAGRESNAWQRTEKLLAEILNSKESV